MEKREFVEHCVLHKSMSPAQAIELWKDTQKAMWDDWRPDLSGNAPGEFLQGFTSLLDSSSNGTRCSVLALLREMYDERTGAKR